MFPRLLRYSLPVARGLNLIMKRGLFLLFGAFLLWAVADRISVKRRAVPHSVPHTPPGPLNDVIVVVGGLLVYAFFLFRVHAWMTGVSPLG